MTVESEIYDSYDPRQFNSRLQAEAPASAPESQFTDEPKFDDRYRQDLDGLLFLGALKKQFVWCGHTFVIRTITQDEYAEVAILAAPWRDTDFSARAFQIATVAASIVTIDGKHLPVIPISTETSEISEKFSYIKARWYSFTFDAIFGEFMALEGRVRDLLEAMGKASG